MPAFDWLIDPASGALSLAGSPPEEILAVVRDLLPPPAERDCARPLGHDRVALPDDPHGPSRGVAGPFVRVHGLAHGVIGCGPGRRSVVSFQGCARACLGCAAIETHDPRGGVNLTAARVAELLLDPAGAPRDGVTVLGGEPFLQPKGLAVILRALRADSSPHVVLYSGYTWEELAARGEGEPDVAASLIFADWLVDGPFVRELADSSGPWAGSRNQRVIDLSASRAFGRTVALEQIPQEETSGHQG
jgi:anaerobic ribonucleoside-triphosphate reductase activating protein